MRVVFDNHDIMRPATEGQVLRLRTADFNNDGRPDIAVLIGRNVAARFFVYLGQGDGTFTAPLITTPAAGSPRLADFDVADVNGDGILDVALICELDPFEYKVQVHHGAGDGTFVAGALLQVTIWSSCKSPMIALADVTSDGRPEVLACGLFVFPNQGGGAFGNAIRTGSGPGGGIRVGDANGDGRPDVFLRYGSQWGTTLLISNGDGTFQAPASIDDRGPLAVADLDGNGRADVVVANDSIHDLGVRLETSGGTYPSRTSAGFLSELEVASVETADMNGDGRPDLLAGGSGRVSIALTRPDGTPDTLRHYAAVTSDHLAAADFDGDGLMDVVTAGFHDGSLLKPLVSVIRGEGGGRLRASEAHVVSWSGVGVLYGGDLAGAALFDATGDGKLDAVSVVADGAARILVLPGNGDGTTGAPIETPIALGTTQAWTVSTHPADFNGDGALDIFLTSGFSTKDLACWLANGDGTFRKSAEIRAALLDAATGDFDGDGNQDFVRTDDGVLHLHPGNGDGTFGTVISAAVGIGKSVLAGDMNNDGIDDLVTGDFVYLGSSARTFTAISFKGSWAYPPGALVDLNADGHLDLVKYDVFGHTGTLTTWVGNGDGTLERARTLWTDQRNAGSRTLTRGLAGDFNADGNIDLAFHQTVLLGDGDGSFNGYARFRYGAHVTALAAADVDGNGSDDLLFVSEQSHSMALVRTWMTESREAPMTLSFVAATPTSVPAGEPVAVDVQASGVGAFLPTGAVVFGAGDHVTALSEFEDGVATGEIRHETVGSNVFTARFTGDNVYAASETVSSSVEVTRASTVLYGTVTPPDPQTNDVIEVGFTLGSLVAHPTGTVTVLVDGEVRGTVDVPEDGFTIGILAAGVHEIALQYGGDASHLPAEYSRLISVAKRVPEMTLTTDPASTANAGTPVTITLSLADPAIAGQVQFSLGAALLGVTTIENGSASWTTSSLPVGVNTLRAFFTGNPEYLARGKSLSHTIVDVPLPPSASSLWVLTPCRVIDTRGTVGPSGGPALASAGTRGIQMTGVCGIPSGAKAVAVNVTVVSPADTGYLTLYPGASARPGTSTMSYRTGRTRANNSVMSLSAGGIVNAFNGGPQPVHLIIDVMGYFE